MSQHMSQTACPRQCSTAVTAPPTGAFTRGWKGDSGKGDSGKGDSGKGDSGKGDSGK
eukprot:gene33686-33008_t